MGLWLKCPGCRANNLLSAKVCSQCGESLENLPPKKRVYELDGGNVPAPRKPAPPPAHKAETAEATPPAAVAASGKKSKRAKKKKE